MATIVGSEYNDNDTFNNGAFRPRLVGYNNSRDSIYGRAGNDILDGLSGADFMYGGSGNDQYYVDSYGDDIIEYANEGLDTVFSSSNHYLRDNVEHLTLTGTAAISGHGNSSINVMKGNSANNTLKGFGGNDFLYDQGGKDTLVGGYGNDYYYLTDPGDVITENADEGNADAVLVSFDYILGNNLEKLSLLDGFKGIGNSLNNVIFGNSKDNTLEGQGGSDTLQGGTGGDRLVGGTGSDRLVGYGGASYEFDTLTGGSDGWLPARDTFVLRHNSDVAYRGTGNALITDWQGGVDKIELRSGFMYILEGGNFSVGASALDTGIYFMNGSTKDLIGVIQDSTNISFSRDAVFV